MNCHATEKLETIPVEYQGRWAPLLNECKPDPIVGGDSPNLFTIKSKHITYYESGCNFISIAKRDNEVAIILGCSGTDEESIAVSHYSISEDHNVLTNITNRLNKLEYYKCTRK